MWVPVGRHSRGSSCLCIPTERQHILQKIFLSTSHTVVNARVRVYTIKKVVCVCVCVCARVCVCACVSVRACARACVPGGGAREINKLANVC